MCELFRQFSTLRWDSRVIAARLIRTMVQVAVLLVSCSVASRTLAAPLSYGVSFSQVDFTYPSATQLYSQYGQVVVDYSQIAGSGYVNVKTNVGWVVQNLPVFGGVGLPGLSMMFDLGYSGVQTAPFEAYVDYSPEPLANDWTLTGSLQSFGNLGRVEHNAEGSAPALTAPPANPAGKMTVAFDPNGKTTRPVINTIRPSVEQDDNQCGPAAVANSLAYLNERYGVPLKHDHIPGINGQPDNSLVGQIDVAVGRKQGQGVYRADLLDGKLKYLDGNRPHGLIIKHQGVFDYENGTVIDTDWTQGRTTSKFMGNLVTLDFLMKEIQHGEDIEMDLVGSSSGGGHVVMITGGGFILGRPWVTFVHDQAQGDNTKGTGLFDGGYGFAWLADPGNGQMIDFKGYLIGHDFNPYRVRNVITESVPEPSTICLLSSGVGLLGSTYWKRRRRLLKV
jgi:hypothetical protein